MNVVKSKVKYRLRGKIMIYITGDTHRDFERIRDFCDEIGTSKEDIMIVLGDAMINYYLDENDIWLKGLC